MVQRGSLLWGSQDDQYHKPENKNNIYGEKSTTSIEQTTLQAIFFQNFTSLHVKMLPSYLKNNNSIYFSDNKWNYER